MMFKHTRLLALALSLTLAPCAWSQNPPPTTTRSAQEILTASLTRVMDIIEPAPGAPLQAFSATLTVTRAEGLPKAIAHQAVEVTFQAPDKLHVSGVIEGRALHLGRHGQQLWMYAPNKNFGVSGTPDVPRFASARDSVDTTPLGPFKLPLDRDQVQLAPLLLKSELMPVESVDGVPCQVLSVVAQPATAEALKIENIKLQLWIRDRDQMPARIRVQDGKKMDLEITLRNIKHGQAIPADSWNMPARAGDKIEKVALAHLKRFYTVAMGSLSQKIPTLGPATGERRLLASSGAGRLEIVDGTKVLVLKGTPEQMGRQHGELMRKQVKDLINRMLYGIGVGSSFEKGRWFFGEIEEAQARLQPHMNARYLAEMDAIATAIDVPKEEVRLANYFPELFHCSGFSIFGGATRDGRMYHGRILDYLKGVGLEQNAVVMVFQPDKGNAWVNISYAGFVGSVTAMNEKHISIGEMGGRGEGNWDGKPMAQLVREVMENAGTIEEAVDIMRRGPRTCEYYYVISDGKSKKAVGIAATPSTFETIWSGQSHPRLPHAIKDTVLMSAGDRYETLAARVKAGYGQFEEQSARDLMTRPVCMNSNVHSVLFAPETLDFWVANADAKNVASHTRYTHYNLTGLLRGPATVGGANSGN